MAASLYPALKYQVQESIFDAKETLDETNFYHQRQGSPSELTRKLTYVLGDANRSHPLSSMTMGGVGYGNKGGAKELDDTQFTYPVMGKDNKVSRIESTTYSAGDKPGIGNTEFEIVFTDNWVKRFYIIESENGTRAYILSEGVPVATGGYAYRAQLDPAGPTDFCPLTELQRNTKWIEMFVLVPESESRTTESKMAMPGLFKNQMSFMRTGMSWAGNAANKVMKIEMTKESENGKKTTTNVWMDYFMWQFEKRWLDDCEHFYWYSKYNRTADGKIALKDLLTGKVIPQGSGVLEQITNRSTFSELTYKTLSNRIGEALYNQGDTGNMSLTLMGGTGARRDFDRVVKAAGGIVVTSFGGAGDLGNKFVTGTGYNLALGGYFDAFYHIDGYFIKFKHAAIFDKGRKAMVGPTHPVSGLPLESHRMVFIDDADVDGQPNIQHVAQTGRAFRHGVIQGLTEMPKSVQIIANVAGSNLISTDVDKSAYTRFKSAGIQILRANRCFDMQCVAGL
jgi:hypothetical protein